MYYVCFCCDGVGWGVGGCGEDIWYWFFLELVCIVEWGDVVVWLVFL